jgi:hypothetical protein
MAAGRQIAPIDRPGTTAIELTETFEASFRIG